MRINIDNNDLNNSFFQGTICYWEETYVDTLGGLGWLCDHYMSIQASYWAFHIGCALGLLCIEFNKL